MLCNFSKLWCISHTSITLTTLTCVRTIRISANCESSTFFKDTITNICIGMHFTQIFAFINIDAYHDSFSCNCHTIGETIFRSIGWLRLIPIIAFTIVGTNGVKTFCVWITIVDSFATFVDITALITITIISNFTFTINLITTIIAIGISVTFVISNGTFIDVFTKTIVVTLLMSRQKWRASISQR